MVKRLTTRGVVSITNRRLLATGFFGRECTGGQGFIFSNGSGTHYWGLGILCHRVIRPALRKAGLQWHGWHACRRGLATNLHELGVPDTVIQRILRHSNVSVTQACYIKTRDRQVADAMSKLAGVVGQPAQAPVAQVSMVQTIQ